MGLYFNIALFLPFDKIENKKIFVLGVVLEEEKSSEYYNRYLLKINNEELQGFKCYINVDKNEKFSCGDIVKIVGNYSRGDVNRNYKGFNYRKYLLQRKIVGIIEAEETKKIGEQLDFEIFFYNIKEKITLSIENIYENNDVKELLECILIGKALQNENIKENFKNSNLSHVLAISGMHVSYIIFGINLVKIENKRLELYFKFLFLNFYLILTGISVSCLRACLMYDFFIISKLCYRKNNIYITAFITLIVSILYNIYNVENVGMWLSFGGTLGIILFHKFIFKSILYKFKIKNKLLCKVIEISCISISAQIFIFPIMIYFFNVISFNFLISNLAIYYLIGPIIILGYIVIIFDLLQFNFLVKILSNLENLFVKLLLRITEFISNHLNFNLYIKTPHIISILIYFTIIIVIIYYCKINRFKFIKSIFKTNMEYSISRIKCINIKKRKNRMIIVLLITIILFNFFINCNINVFRRLEISFIDVGQGDCTYIRTPENKHILIDGGEGNSEKYDYGKNVLFPYLLDKRINKIDFLIVSHFDSDHVGGLIYILNNIKVKNIIIGIQPEKSKQLEDLIKIGNDKRIKILILKSKDKLEIEKDIYLDVIWPNEENIIYDNVLNNNSLVFKFCYKKLSILFTGDIEESAENEIVKLYSDTLKSTILKVAHHGSRTSTSNKFLESVSPEIALIGVGKDNMFNHPNKEIIEKLKKYNIEIFRTDLNGEINIIIRNNKKIRVKTKLKYKAN